MRNNKAVGWLKKQSPLILACIGAAGTVATAILAAKETPKALQLLENAKSEKGEELTKVETVVNAAPAYWPAVAVGAATITCIFGSHVLNRKQQATIISAYNALYEYGRQYRQTLIDLKGKEVDEEIKAEMARRYPNYHRIDMNVPDKKVTFYDEVSGSSFDCYEREIMDAEYHFNRNFVLKCGELTVNDWCDMIGVPHVENGDKQGWSMADGYSWIDWEHYPLEHHSSDDGGPDVVCIAPIFPPEDLWLEEDEEHE